MAYKLHAHNMSFNTVSKILIEMLILKMISNNHGKMLMQIKQAHGNADANKTSMAILMQIKQAWQCLLKC